MDKQKLAETKRKQRLQYTVLERAPWDMLIHNALIPIANVYRVVGIYASYNGEVDTYGIIETLLWDPTIIVCLPRIEKTGMNFYRIHSLDDLKKGHFGILEPQGEELYFPDLMVVPLSVFNEACHRIGYGKGYYDSYFKDHQCFKVGLAYDFQKTTRSFETDNDVPCDVIITEKELYYVA